MEYSSISVLDIYLRSLTGLKKYDTICIVYFYRKSYVSKFCQVSVFKYRYCLTAEEGYMMEDEFNTVGCIEYHFDNIFYKETPFLTHINSLPNDTYHEKFFIVSEKFCDIINKLNNFNKKDKNYTTLFIPQRDNIAHMLQYIFNP